MSWGWPTTRLHTPVVGRVLPQSDPVPLQRVHGGMDHILPIGLEEVPLVDAGGNGALTGTSGEGVVCDPLAIAGGIVISSIIHIDGSSMSPSELIALVEFLEERELTHEERKYFGEEE